MYVKDSRIRPSGVMMNQPPNYTEKDRDVDWLIAQKVKGARETTRHIWEDYSPTSNPREAYELIEKFKIDVRYYDPKLYPEREGNPWMGGLQYQSHVYTYYTAWGSTSITAAMKALAKCLEENDIWT